MALYSAIESHVVTRRSDFSSAPDDPAKRGAITEMRTLLTSARKLQSVMAWIDAISEPPLDLGTTYFVELAARRLVGSNAELLAISAEEASYSTYRNPYEKVIADWGDPTEIAGDTVIVLFLPRREQRSGLLHPLLVHELGHAVCQTHDLTSRAYSQAIKRKRLQSRFATTAAAHALAEGLLPQEAALQIVNRMQGWLEEALCDAIATQYLGPTYLYSFVAEVAAGNVDRAGKKHPPPRQRIRMILDHLGWASTMKAAANGLDDWVRAISGEHPAYSGVEAFLVWTLDTVAKEVRRRVASLVQPHTFSPDSGELDEIKELLAAGIPPAQRQSGETINSCAVILGSWLFALEAAGGDVSSIPVAADSEELAKLLPKGLEMTALMSAWN